MSNWFKILALMALMMTGMSAAASAHEGNHAYPSVSGAAVSHVSDRDGSDVSYFENAHVNDSDDCQGECCCCGGVGPMHCGAGGCGAAALGGTGIFASDQDGRLILHGIPEPLLHDSASVSGLERPPKA